MSDDLVKRLRKGVMCGDDPIVDEAADRIEKLEAALREIAALGLWDGDSAMSIARKTLEGKDG
jgi:DNA-binding IclR family transcriptional regulator